MSKQNLSEIKNKKTPIEIAAYIEQINQRERKYASVNKVFTLNVKSLNIITEKPQLPKISHITQVPLEIRNQVDYFFKTPVEKYKNPITTSHEYGWDKPKKTKVFKTIYSKNTNDITNFASIYWASKGISPFASTRVKASSPSPNKS